MEVSRLQDEINSLKEHLSAALTENATLRALCFDAAYNLDKAGISGPLTDALYATEEGESKWPSA